MTFHHIFLLAFCFAVSTAKRSLPSLPYPCNLARCHSKLPVCRIQKVDCFTSPCYPTAVCTGLPSSPLSVCPVGRPVINADLNEINCFSGGYCPDGTYCNGGRCCWSGTTSTKPGSCPPQKRSTRKIRVKRCGQPCSIDSDCYGTQKCCLSGGCGHICRPVIDQNVLF